MLKEWVAHKVEMRSIRYSFELLQPDPCKGYARDWSWQEGVKGVEAVDVEAVSVWQ